MKKLLVIIFLCSIAIVNAQEIEVSHSISKVTVYMNSAEIVRQAKVQLPQGKSTLIFKGISENMKTQGLQISLPKGVKTYSIVTEKKPVKFEQSSDWKVIKKKYDKTKDTLGLIKITVNSLNSQISFLKGNMELNSKTLATVNQLNAHADYFQNKMEAIHLKLYKLNKKTEEIKKRLLKIQEEKNKLESKLRKRNMVIKAVVVAQAPISADIQLQYSVGQAQWKPYYAIYATEKNPTLDFYYQAQIYNNTGNDWSRQKLTLAIVNTSDDLDLPVLNTWVLSNNTYGYDSEGLLNTDVKGLAWRSSNVVLKDTANIGNKYSVIKVDDINTKFVIDALQDIPSDATPHLIDVKTYHPKVDYFSLSIPKVKRGAFLIAKLPHWRQMSLMDAKINLFYNQTYQGTSLLNTRQVKDTLDISLGKDKSFNVYRRKLKSQNKEKLIGLNLMKELTYEIVIQNNKNAPQDIEVRDQIPVSGDSDIKVIPIDLAGANVDDISGQLMWKVHLKALETRKIVFSFKVKYPKSKRELMEDIDDRRIRSPKFF